MTQFYLFMICYSNMTRQFTQIVNIELTIYLLLYPLNSGLCITQIYVKPIFDKQFNFLLQNLQE